jgi:hypothetical protein
MDRLKDRKALVVGAAGRDNMGQVIARRLAAESLCPRERTRYSSSPTPTG